MRTVARSNVNSGTILSMVECERYLVSNNYVGHIHLWDERMILLRKWKTGYYLCGWNGGVLINSGWGSNAVSVIKLLKWNRDTHSLFPEEARRSIRTLVACNTRKRLFPMDVLLSILRELADG